MGLDREWGKKIRGERRGGKRIRSIVSGWRQKRGTNARAQGLGVNPRRNGGESCKGYFIGGGPGTRRDSWDSYNDLSQYGKKSGRKKK